ncbi:putative isoquinoline 1-oxidoreductase beta subunit [Caenibius tardaugens NBRC 16725]|uniref:Putative isoquinoline 1-oxidoreductase beta subunit n=2 Tax=Caenibius TaxID=2827482 RepID=U2YQ94_9SPHN|nr:molybdopterin cofactor-binding domain-containing protein [Caenibius tardaugens]GAD50807.1 putative isoquinoline 1-oxidoreductase beta subunit [Caenibius tardaugens NBRC 16725]
MELTRRGLLIGAAVGGGLFVAWGLGGRHFAPPLTPREGEFAFDAWLKIARDGVVSVAQPQLEMGQGISTLLPQIVAMELGADWRQIAVEPAPVSGAYPNMPLAARWAPLWMPLAPSLADQPGDWLTRRFAETERFTATAEGLSLAAYEGPARAAAASARAMLAMAAADRWNVAWEECEASGGFIRHGKKALSFAALAEDAAGQTPPDPPPLRPEPAAERPVDPAMDAPLAFPRLDLPAKVDGTYQFAGDVRLPDMVYAAIRHGPLPQPELGEADTKDAAGTPGLISVVQGKRWVAAVATNWWAAEQALAKIHPLFANTQPVESGRIEEALDKGVRHGETHRIAEVGDGDAGLDKPTLALRYDVAPATHATLETASATARLRDGKLELWVASQAPERARRAVAGALDMSESDVVLYPMPAGGSFDRRLEHDHAVEAALIARETGRPVQLIWSRWQEMVAGRPRTPVAAVLAAKTDNQGNIATFRARLALPASAREFGYRLFGEETPWDAVAKADGTADPMVVEGAMPPYGIANMAVDHVPVTLPLSTGRMRGNAHGYTAFFVESFIDELARRNKREALSYRVSMLGKDLRLAACLQKVARLAEWDGGNDQSGQGLACHRIDEGCIAVIATASRGEGGVRVERLRAVADIGRIVNLDIARQQIEGGLIFGIGCALGAALTYEGGLPDNARLAGLNLPVLGDCPAIEVDFLESDADPFDPGELGVAVVAPAIANALYSATGLRFRRLPLLSDGL